MSKIRVRELAKELNKSSREIIQVLKMHGIDVESHTSILSEEKAKRIRSYYARAAAADKAGKKPAARPVRPEARQQMPKRPVQPAGGLDENGNFSMSSGGYSFDGRSDADKRMAERKNAERLAKKAAEKPEIREERPAAAETQAQPVEKKTAVEPAVQAAPAAETAAPVKQETPAVKETAAEVKAPEVKAPETKEPAETPVKTEQVSKEPEKVSVQPAKPETEVRPQTKDAENNREKSAPRDGQQRPARPAARDG